MATVSELVTAASTGDLATIRKLTEKGQSASASNYDKRTALHLACAEGQMATVRRLCDEMEAKVNAKDKWGGTPLDAAVRNRQKPIIDFLLTKGAKSGTMLMAVDDFRVVSTAVEKGDVDCVVGLFQRKVDINEGDYDKRSPLHLACASGNFSMVQCLVDVCEADINVFDGKGGTPLDSALRGGHMQIVTFLRTKGANAGKAVVDTDAATKLCDAAANGDVERLRELRSQGVDVNSGDYDMRTAMHLAASEGILPVIKCLVTELGGNQNVTDRWGGTPLDDAIRQGHKNVQTWLEENLGVRGVKEMYGNEASLMCASAAEGDSTVLTGLVAQKVDVNVTNHDKRTPLHVAAACGHLEVVKVLVDELHANFSVKDRFGSTPLDDASRANHAEVEEFLEAHSAPRTVVLGPDEQAAALCDAAASGDLETLAQLVQGGGDVNMPNYDRRTPLHMACAFGHLGVVQALVEEMDASLNPIDFEDGTPLDDAVDAQFTEVIDYLADHGCKRRRTALPEKTSMEADNTDPAPALQQSRASGPCGSVLPAFLVNAFGCRSVQRNGHTESPDPHHVRSY